MILLWGFLAVTLVFATETHGAQVDRIGRPTIVWASDPVLPDETVVLTGGDFADDVVAEIRRLADGATAATTDATRWHEVVPLQVGRQCVKFVLPERCKMGLFQCRVRQAEMISNTVCLNAPDPWWMQGDRGETASPGGWLRIFGKCLNFDEYAKRVNGPASRAKLQVEGGKVVVLPPAKSSCYALRLAIPADLAAGRYEVAVHNGFGGDAGWRNVGTVTVKAPEPWPSQVFNVKELGLATALKKADDNGGGVVYFPCGIYALKNAIQLPPFTVLKGEGMGLVNLVWPRGMTELPVALITGKTFGVEDLSIYCKTYRHIIYADDLGSDGVRIHRVRIRANCFFMHEQVGDFVRGYQAVKSHLETGIALVLPGKNFEVTDCDIYASNYGVWLGSGSYLHGNAGPRYGLIARNTIRFGGQRGWRIQKCDKIIFEHNQIVGNNLLAQGNDIITSVNNYAQNLYFAHNRTAHIYGGDREAMTLDNAAGGPYWGKLAKVDGMRLTLAGDPIPRNRGWEHISQADWSGCGVWILGGKGAGQCRRVTQTQGRLYHVDHPWVVLPDETSVISIMPYRGHLLFVDNVFEDCGVLCFYGSSVECIAAENRAFRMDGFRVTGIPTSKKHPGLQASWYCQFLDNRILEGQGYCGMVSSVGTGSPPPGKEYAGPLIRGCIMRRNSLEANAWFSLGGTTADTLVENGVVRNVRVGLEAGPHTTGIIFRKNSLENVDVPLWGDGIAKALFIP